MALHFDVSLALVIAAVISGGVFGDHSSVISDTSVIASMASECDHIVHVKDAVAFGTFKCSNKCYTVYLDGI